jgi:uncharacterized membrane protein
MVVVNKQMRHNYGIWKAMAEEEKHAMAEEEKQAMAMAEEEKQAMAEEEEEKQAEAAKEDCTTGQSGTSCKDSDGAEVDEDDGEVLEVVDVGSTRR